ncbi:hypothetical protein IMZ48_03445 [Candidatus Bathyarchaeota archaeon]|nr:hypothetical protein [Candidatus Bathyarchaeota archaeon]
MDASLHTMQAQPPPPSQNAETVDSVTNNGPISPETKPDAEMTEPPAAAKSSNSPLLVESWSPSPPIDPPTSQSANPVPASAIPTHSDGRPAVPSLSASGRVSPVENKEGTMRPPPASATTTSQAAGTTPTAASPHIPQAAPQQVPQHAGAPSFNSQPSQLQSSPSLSQQAPANPAGSLPSMAPTNPPTPTPHAQTMAPTPSPANHAPPAPTHSSLPSSKATTPVQGPVAYRAPSGQSSPASSQQTPFREPHTPSAHDPYTSDNIFSGGGFYLPDPTDNQLSTSNYIDQCNQLYAVMRTMHPSVVRRVVRDTWTTSLTGSEAHISFVVSLDWRFPLLL